MAKPSSPKSGLTANTSVAWSDKYPAQEIIRAEVQSMIDCTLQALLEIVPPEEIEQVTAKGSALKTWTSPLDYVPEISDIDIHVHFGEGADTRYLGTVEQALRFQARVEHLYTSKVPSHVHFPRLQVMVVNRLVNQPGYIPSPAGTVSVLYGAPYAQPDIDEEESRQIDRQRLLEHKEFLAVLPMTVMDKPGKHLWPALRLLSWRVSPVGPRVLSLLGVPYEEAWGTNRTRIVELLTAFGVAQLAADYAAFYLHGWDYFLSGYKDGDAGRLAVLSGARALEGGIAIAEAWPGATPVE